MTRPPLRVGRISALNMYPIYHHLEGPSGRHLRFTDGLPTTLNTALLANELDLSAVSSITYARHSDELRLLPVASITAAGAVDSIQLFSRVPFDAVKTVAVTPHSASSVALLRVLIGPSVRFETLRGPASEALDHVDGALVIADEALRDLRAGFAPFSTDLGARWTQETGLPMVFAVWAVRDEVARERASEVGAVADLLREARAAYAQNPGPVIDAAVDRFGLPPEEIERYFARLRYGFGRAEIDGLSAFCERARAAGELDTLPQIPRQAA
jgi:chorismate dehydratase